MRSPIAFGLVPRLSNEIVRFTPREIASILSLQLSRCEPLTTALQRVKPGQRVDVHLRDIEKRLLVEELDQLIEVPINVGNQSPKQPLNAALLTANRQVHHEASRILYGENVFHISLCHKEYSNSGSYTPSRAIASQYMPLVKTVIFTIRNNSPRLTIRNNTSRHHTSDPIPAADSVALENDISDMCQRLVALNLRLKKLFVRYITPFAAFLDEFRGFGHEDRLVASDVFATETCLAPLRLFAGRVRELDIRGEIDYYPIRGCHNPSFNFHCILTHGILCPPF